MADPLRISLVAVLLVPLSGVGCKDKVLWVDCPPGTVAKGSECIDPNAVDVVEPGEPDVDAVAFPDFPTADNPSDATPPTPDHTPDPIGPDPVGPGDDGEPDLPIVDAGPPGVVGAACQTNGECDGGTCLDWPGGYCTQLECDAIDISCGAGAVCTALAGGNHACLAGCAEDADCRPGGQQACKVLAEAGGGVCHGVREGAGPVGALCADDSHCLGASLCLSIMPGGYCGLLGCDQTPCPAASECVKVDGVPTCLASCQADVQCGGEPGAERQCTTLKNLDKVEVDVCVSGAAGKTIGEACQSGFECQSATCEVLGDGRCSQTNTPCFFDGDCAGVEFCSINPSSKVGVCTTECAVAVPCPGASFCVGQPGLAQGWCRIACNGANDVATCGADDGFACQFGYPLGDSSGQGRYLCARDTPGGPGQVCDEDAGCVSSECFQPIAGADGLCTAPCLANQYCPFPGTCVSSPAPPTCHKACFSPLDCPASMACTQPSGSLRKVCQ